jgi:hypothetical protein
MMWITLEQWRGERCLRRSRFNITDKGWKAAYAWLDWNVAGKLYIRIYTVMPVDHQTLLALERESYCRG